MRQPEATKLDRGSIVYRGEGNATLVIALKDKKKVLRFQKYSTDQPIDSIEADLQRHIWFSSNVLRKILYKEMFDEPSMVVLSEEDMKYINDLWNESRPGYRICKVIPNQNPRALLLNDYCCLPITPSMKNYVVGPVITVEIKPKQGFSFIIGHHEANICRFSLKQAFKLESSRTQTESHYCPLNLFSGCRTRMRNALKNLISTPQNNFRLFCDAELTYSEQNTQSLNSLLSGFICENFNEDQRSERILIDLIIDSLLFPFGENSSVMSNLDFQIATPSYCSYHHTPPCDFECKASHDLPSKCVLATVLRLQMLDTIGSYGALNIINSLKSLSPESIPQLDSFGESHHNSVPFPPKGFGSPFRFPREAEVDYYLRKLWEYLISIIAKDCSIMISMQRLKKNNSTNCDCTEKLSELHSRGHISCKDTENPSFAKDIYKNFTSPRCHIIHDKITDTSYAVSIAIIDLDLKKSSKITDVYYREMKIIKAFNNRIASLTR